MKAIETGGSHFGIAYTGKNDSPLHAPYFALEMEEGGTPSGLVLAAGLCSETAGLEEMEMRRYAIALLSEFFKKKGREIDAADYGRVLVRTFDHIHRYISGKWPGQDAGLDLVVVLADTQTAYAARSGGGVIYVYHEGDARPVFAAGSDGGALLGTGSWEVVEVEKAQLLPGDIMVVCDPVVARVIGPRDITVILRRAPDPEKASLFLSAIAERKGASGPMTSLIWEVPNYQGAAILTAETPPATQPEDGEEAEVETGEESAELAKKQWLSKWRRRRE